MVARRSRPSCRSPSTSRSATSDTAETTQIEVPMVRIAVRGWLGFVEAASLEWLLRGQADRTQLRDLLVDTLLVTVRAVMGPPLTGGW